MLPSREPGLTFLSTLDKEHIETIRVWRNEPQIWRWCRQNNLITEPQQLTWFESQSQDPTIRMFGVFDSRRQLVGVCGLTSIDLINRRAEFSCYIAPQFQRLGHCRRALCDLFDYGFEQMNLHQIWGETFAQNPALELFLDLGMIQDGVRRDFYFKDGQYTDAILISVLSHEWMPQ